MFSFDSLPAAALSLFLGASGIALALVLVNDAITGFRRWRLRKVRRAEFPPLRLVGPDDGGRLDPPSSVDPDNVIWQNFGPGKDRR